MKRICLFLVVIACLLPVDFFGHPVHVSVTTIEFIPEKKGFVIGIKIFYDDLQTEVFNRYKERLTFDTDEKNGNRICDQYIRDVIGLSINGKPVMQKMKYVRSEMNQEALWIYYILPFRDKVEEMKITNSILHTLYPDQKNLLIVKSGDFEKGFTLNHSTTECSILL